MTVQTYTTRIQTKQYRPVLTEQEYWECNNEYLGFCLACGKEAHNVEPDARRYECQSCGAAKVYGLEELLMMGVLRLA